MLSRPVQTYIPFDDTVLESASAAAETKEPAHPPDPRRRRRTRELSSIQKALDLNHDRTFNDAGMASLKGMTNLTTLYLRGTSITDDGLKNLAGLTKLTELDLADVAITDEGLSALAGLTHLRTLNLQASSVNPPAGLDAIRGMTGLEELSLYRTKVTNVRGLAKLANLKQLRAVDLRYSRATASGVQELVAGLPTWVKWRSQGSSTAVVKADHERRIGCLQRGTGHCGMAALHWSQGRDARRTCDRRES